jgi:hypothetical protein
MRTLLALLAICFAMPAAAHDPNHPELNRWLESLRSSKGPCCTHVDGIAVADPDWVTHDGHYRVRVPSWDDRGRDMMIWVDVPDDAVITQPNLTGRAWVWPVRMSNGVTIRCFLPGSMT